MSWVLGLHVPGGVCPELAPFCLPGSALCQQDMSPSPRVPGEVGAQWGLQCHRQAPTCHWGECTHTGRAACACIHTHTCVNTRSRWCTHTHMSIPGDAHTPSCTRTDLCTHTLTHTHPPRACPQGDPHPRNKHPNTRPGWQQPQDFGVLQWVPGPETMPHFPQASPPP